MTGRREEEQVGDNLSRTDTNKPTNPIYTGWKNGNLC